MTVTILPQQLVHYLNSSSTAGFVYLSSLRLTGKSTLVTEWALRTQQTYLKIDCAHQTPNAADLKEMETTIANFIPQTALQESTTSSSPTDKPLPETSDLSVHEANLNKNSLHTRRGQSGITYEQKQCESSIGARSVVIFDHVPFHTDEHVSGWLASLIQRHEEHTLYILISDRHIPPTLLQLAFERRGLLLDTSHIRLQTEDLLAAYPLNQWGIPISTLADLAESSGGHNLVLLAQLAQQHHHLNQHIVCPEGRTWEQVTFEGLTHDECMAVRLLEMLGWALPTVLKLLSPELNIQTFLNH
ncbi:MAG: hypothetical protein P8077_04605 [Gammaproteobacteria bacterium]